MGGGPYDGRPFFISPEERAKLGGFAQKMSNALAL